ncbi:MAG: 30S ribosomal protein S3 [Planctomycetes bacterium]|nr:30S ribosomal protein S3 [Planctomycetota bacterium]
MGQKVHPTGFRTGVSKAHRSRWFARGGKMGDYIVEDHKIRNFIKKEYTILDRSKAATPIGKFAQISKIEIERQGDAVKVLIFCARPVMLIGKRGDRVQELTGLLKVLTGKEVDIDVIEVKEAELEAQVQAEDIAEQLLKRQSFRRVLKRTIDAVMKNGRAEGVRIIISGRLGGAEIARSEKMQKGKLPLSTLWADVDFGFAEATTTYGVLGIKVWIYRGEIQKKAKQEVNA